MNKLIPIFLAVIAIISFSSCGDDKDNMMDLAKKYIAANYPADCKIEITETTEPDSTFGIMYLTEDEMMRASQQINKVTTYIMEKTKNMTDYNPSDGKMAFLASKQMKAAAEMNEVMAHSQDKGQFNGWKMRANYKVKYKNGERKVEQWLFFDKGGDVIYNSFTIHLP